MTLTILCSVIPAEGGYAVDEHGIHHVTIVSPLEVEHPLGAHAVVHVCRDRLVMEGKGGQPSRTMRLRSVGDEGSSSSGGKRARGLS